MELLSGLPTHLHPLDVAARLEEFRALEDGWFEDTGKAPDLKGLDWLADHFNRNFPDDLPLPYTFPTPKGGVEMEWLFDSQSIHLEIDIVEHRGNWLRYDKYADDNEEERDLNLNDESDWSWFAGEIRRLLSPICCCKGTTYRPKHSALNRKTINSSPPTMATRFPQRQHTTIIQKTRIDRRQVSSPSLSPSVRHKTCPSFPILTLLRNMYLLTFAISEQTRSSEKQGDCEMPR